MVSAWLLLITSLILTQSSSTDGESTNRQANSPQWSEPLVKELVGDPTREAPIVAANALSQQIASTEWLGPLSAVAMSPFFGVTCLSGLALFGNDYLPDNHALLRAATPLKNPWLFGSFALLTLLTSLPRFSKVSKPFAQAADQLETWAGIISLLLIRFSTLLPQGSAEPAIESTAMIMLPAGIGSITMETFLSIAIVINMLIVSAVRYFFEFLIWISPIPLIDAFFELMNKTVCAALIALYAFSPFLATIVNLAILAISALIFRFAIRRVRVYRTLATEPIMRWIGFGRNVDRITAFTKTKLGPFAGKERIVISRTADGWLLEAYGFFTFGKKLELPQNRCQLRARRGWLTTTFLITGEINSELLASRRNTEEIKQIENALQLDATTASKDSQSKAHLEFV